MKERLLYNGTKRLPEIFSEEELREIIKQISNSKDYWKKGGYKDWGNFFKIRDICLIVTIYSLGCRPKEACCLKFSDFDFKIMNVRIRGKNNKTGKDRVIPVPFILMKFYREYFKFPKSRFWKGSKYLFPSFQRDHISPERLKHLFREKVLKPANLWEAPTDNKVSKYRLYTLRHSRASHILKKQIKEKGQPDLFAIANFLGHSDIRSTMVYLHTDESYREYLRGQIEL